MPKPPASPQLPMLGITSDPLPMPPEMFAVIGEIVVLWSRIESALATDTSSMMQYAVVRKLAASPPHGFKKRLELWHRAVRTLYPKIEAYQQHASAFADAARKVAHLRNHLIHGGWGLEPTERGGYLVTNFEGLKKTDRPVVYEFTMELIGALLADIRALDKHIVSFVASKMLHAHLGLLQADPSP